MTEPGAAPTPADNASMAEDFIDIIVAPSKVFTRRAKASPMVPFVVVWILMAVIFYAGKSSLQPVYDTMIQQQNAATMKANPAITQEQLDKAKPITNFVFSAIGIIGTPIFLIVVALVIWIIGRFVMGGVLEFGTALLIASYACIPKVVSSVIGLVEGMTMDVSRMTSPYQLTISAARFFDPASMTTGMYGLLAQLDPLTIWSLFLIASGLMYAGKVEKSKATIAAVIMFVLGCVPSLIAVLMGK
jgi:hypothetical protein